MLTEVGLRYITALTDAQVRRPLGRGILQLRLFSEQMGEEQAEMVRYISPKNPTGSAVRLTGSADLAPFSFSC